MNGRSIKKEPEKTTLEQGDASFAAMSPSDFERFARRVLEAKYTRPLPEQLVERVAKRFDFVADDLSVIGDAKYFTLVGGKGYPPAKMSVIAEHVWLLESTEAGSVFLIFGNDRRVPEIWLAKYGHLVRRVKFYFLTKSGDIVSLN